MPPTPIDRNRHDGHMIPRGLPGPTQGVVIGTLVGSFVFFGLLIWLYHCVNEEKGAYGTPLYSRRPSPPRRLRDLGPPNGGMSTQGRSHSLSPPRAPRPSVGLRAPKDSPLGPVPRAASHAPAQIRGNSPLRPWASSPLRPRASAPFKSRANPRPRTPSPRPPPQAPRVPQIRRTSPSPRPYVAPPGRDLDHDLERTSPRDLHHDLDKTRTSRTTGPSALQLERERDLARRMAEENDRERSHRSSSLSGRRPPRIVVGTPGNPARRPPPSSSSSSSSSSLGPVIVMAEPGRARTGALPPPPLSSSSASSAPRDGRRIGNTGSHPRVLNAAHPGLGSPIAMAEPRRSPPPPSSSSMSSSLGDVRHGRRRVADPIIPMPQPGRRHSARSPLPPPLPTSQNARTRASDAKHVPAADELRHPSQRPPSSASLSQGPSSGRLSDPSDLGRRVPLRSASSAGREGDGERMNRSYERVRRVPGGWRD